MSVRTWLDQWPVYRQLTGTDPLGRGAAVESPRKKAARTTQADKVVQSVCPYCAVGCGQRVYVKDGEVTQFEGDPDSPVSRGRLCPKGSASKQLVTNPGRIHDVLYRRPYGTEWERLPLDRAMEMIADRVLATRKQTWQDEDDGKPVRRTMGIASLGGATLDNEENYLMKKIYTAMGAVLAFDTPPPFPVWEPRSVAAVPRRSSRTSPTRTASSSRVRTWLSAIRSDSSGWWRQNSAVRG
jgi:formate dehydrogenase major subunit